MDPSILEQFKTIGELLLGAAHADGKLAGSESDRVAAILGAIIPAHEQLSAVNAHLDGFDPADLDLKAACERLPASEQTRREVLQALAQVTEADGVQDLTESEYIRQVAEHLGLSQQDWQALAFEIVSSQPADVPPPVPSDEDGD